MANLFDAALQPCVRLMQNLRLPAKFLLISVAFIVPLSVTLHAVVGYANDGLQFAHQERLGVTYIKTINEALHSALEARSSNIGTHDNTRGIAALQAVAAQDTNDELKIRQAINALSGTNSNDQFIETLLELTDQVADNSNLMLDPDLDSYYTMMVAVHYSQHEMALATSLGEQLAGIGAGAIAPQSLARIQDLATRMTIVNEDAKDALQRITLANPPVGAQLNGGSWHGAIQKLLDSTHDAEMGNATGASNIRFLVDAAEQESYLMNGRALEALDRLLASRIGVFQSRRNNSLLLALAGLVVSAYLIVGFYLSNQGGFRALATRMQKMASGDLTVNYPARGSDEIGVLINAFNDSRAQLQVLVERIHHAADTISTAGREISSANMDLAQRSSAQAAVIDETANRVAQITEKVQSNLDAASNANQIAREAQSAAGNGKVVVDSVVTTMDAMTGSSKRIGAIIDVINEIAFQTNLLALNAAVEAARAGEQGRGFAVVAGEVRNLAQRCATAANEITHLIKASVGDVDKGVAQVANAGASMQEILAAVGSVSNIMNDMTDASKAQIQAIRGIDTAVGKINDDAQQNAAIVEETAAAAGLLREQVAVLIESVTHFTLGAETTGPQLSPLPDSHATPDQLRQVA